MTPKIYISSHDVLIPGTNIDTGREHSYLIFDPDLDDDGNYKTDLGTDSEINEFDILRGSFPGVYDDVNDDSLYVEVRDVVTESTDYTIALDSQNYVQVASLGQAQWNQMWTFAQTMGDLHPIEPGAYDTDLTYSTTPPLFEPNSNSVINTLLNIVGVNFRDFIPSGQNVEDYPGHMALVDGSSDSLFTAYIYNGPVTDTTTFYKRGGDDTILLEWNNVTDEHARLDIYFANDTLGLTTVYMDGLDYTDVVFIQSGNGLAVDLTGDILVDVKDFFDAGDPEVAFQFEDILYQRGNASDNVIDASNSNQDALLEGYDGVDTITGGSGNDILIGGAGNDVLNGGLGFDTANYAAEAAGITADLILTGTVTDGSGGSDTLTSIENIVGSAYDDTLTVGIETVRGVHAGGTQGGVGDTLTFFNDNGSNDVFAGIGHTVLADGTIETSNGVVYNGFENINLVSGSVYDTAYYVSTVNRVVGFDETEDVLNIANILDTNYDPLTDLLSDFVDVVDNGQHTFIRIDEDGTGTASSMNTVARIDGYTGHGHDETDMINQGYLLV